jgi:hypothetical protein
MPRTAPRIRLTPDVMAQAFARVFRRRGARSLFTVQKVFQLSPAELGQLFGVRRPTIEQWLSEGVPIRHAAIVDRIAELALYLNHLFKTQRLPEVAREKLSGLDNRSVLEVLRTEGCDPMYKLLRALHELIPDADPIRRKASADEMSDAPEAEAYQLPIETVVKRLLGLAGVSVTGIIGSVKNERSLRRWVTGDQRPDREPQLRFAYRVAFMLASVCGAHVVQSWFKGSNTSLGDRAPAMVLRDDFSEETQVRILNAARRLMQ